MTVFSRRHRRAISDRKLDVSLDMRLRGRIWRLMENFNESWYYQPDSNDKWTEQTDSIEQATKDVLDVMGEEKLTLGFAEVSTEKWVKSGIDAWVLDFIELFYLQLPESNRPAFTSDLNRVLGEEDAVWRMLDGQFVRLDAVFVHEQIVASSQETLRSVRFEGPAKEMLDAQHDLADQDARGAVHNAGSSFESTMKAALGESGGHLTAKPLIKALQDAGWLDGLPEELRGGFATQVVLALPWMRNHLGGHGQGRDELPLPEPYARLALGLAASFNEFVVALAMERDSSLAKATDEGASNVEITEADYIPVSAAEGPSFLTDEDIPF